MATEEAARGSPQKYPRYKTPEPMWSPAGRRGAAGGLGRASMVHVRARRLIYPYRALPASYHVADSDSMG